MRRLVIFSLLLLGCGGDEGRGASRPARVRPLVCATTWALHSVASRIAGAGAEVVAVVPAGIDPLHWQPGAAAIERMQGADLILLNGAGAERWVGQVSLPISRIVETAHGLRDRYLRIEGAVTHSHGGKGTHTHSGVDPHTWLDPINATEQARAILDALQSLTPGASAALQQRFDALAADLRKLHRELAALELRSDEVVVAAQASYHYLARRYGWEVRDAHLDPAGPAGGGPVSKVREILAGARARVVLWESPPAAETARRLRDVLGLHSVVFDPGAVVPRQATGDWLTRMHDNVRHLREALR